MAKHTPGPWIVDGLINARYLRGIGDVVMIRKCAKDDDRYVAMVSLDCMNDDRIATTHEERGANARLVAAAPAMREALEKIQAEESCSPVIAYIARAALAAGEG